MAPAPDRTPSSADGDDVRAFLDGDGSAFERIVDRYQRPMLGFCQRLLDGAEDARDLFQEVFLQAYRSMGQLREPAALRTWLYRIAVRRARRVQFRRTPDRLESDPDQIQSDDTDDTVEQRERALALRTLITTLPERQRECLVLRHFQNLRYRDIAEVLDISEEAARASHYQGLRRLRLRLDPDDAR